MPAPPPTNFVTETVPQHDKEQRQNHYCGRQHLRQRFGYHLSQSVYVVGVITHYVAVAVGVEVLDRQILHAVEHHFARLFEKALREYRHKLTTDRARYKREHVQSDQYEHLVNYILPRIYARAFYDLAGYRKHAFHENGRQRTYDCVEHDTQKRHREHLGIELEQQLDGASEHAFIDFFLIFFIHSGSVILHRRLPPCFEYCTLRCISRFYRAIPCACRRRLSFRLP